MTQKTSFKSRMKQAFSFFRSDLRACTPLLVVFGLISAVTVVICYTICVVLGDDMTFTGALLSLNFLGVTNSGTGIIEIFQYSSANLIYLISIIFTIIYTVRIYSYLHNKRKADLYGSLPIGRSTLFVTKTASAYLMSIIPTLFFLGVISIITVCTGNSVISELSSMFLKNMPRNTCINLVFRSYCNLLRNNAQLRAYVHCGLRGLSAFRNLHQRHCCGLF